MLADAMKANREALPMICPYCSKSFDHRSVDTPGPGCGCGKAAHDADMDGTVDARTDPAEFARRSNRCDAADDALAAALRGEDEGR